MAHETFNISYEGGNYNKGNEIESQTVEMTVWWDDKSGHSDSVQTPAN